MPPEVLDPLACILADETDTPQLILSAKYESPEFTYSEYLFVNVTFDPAIGGPEMYKFEALVYVVAIKLADNVDCAKDDCDIIFCVVELPV